MKRRPASPELTADEQVTVAKAMVPIVLGKAIAEALEKGYVVQFVPAGDPHVWRTLAERADGLFEWMDRLEMSAKIKAEFAPWRDDFKHAIAAYTLQRPEAT